MSFINIEIKARCENPEAIESLLVNEQANFIGTDRQTDTYFNVAHGRLKLREGLIENALIHYHRPDQPGLKKSEVLLFKTEPGSLLKEILVQSLGIKVIVSKQRKIFYIDNLKFHIDTVNGLGSFVEIEAFDDNGRIDEGKLRLQCETYLKKFGIGDTDLLTGSYSDLILQTKINSTDKP